MKYVKTGFNSKCIYVRKKTELVKWFYRVLQGEIKNRCNLVALAERHADCLEQAPGVSPNVFSSQWCKWLRPESGRVWNVTLKKVSSKRILSVSDTHLYSDVGLESVGESG